MAASRGERLNVNRRVEVSGPVQSSAELYQSEFISGRHGPHSPSQAQMPIMHQIFTGLNRHRHSKPKSTTQYASVHELSVERCLRLREARRKANSPAMQIRRINAVAKKLHKLREEGMNDEEIAELTAKLAELRRVCPLKTWKTKWDPPAEDAHQQFGWLSKGLEKYAKIAPKPIPFDIQLSCSHGSANYMMHNVPDSTSIAAVKQFVYEVEGTPPNQQRLFYGGQQPHHQLRGMRAIKLKDETGRTYKFKDHHKHDAERNNERLTLADYNIKACGCRRCNTSKAPHRTILVLRKKFKANANAPPSSPPSPSPSRPHTASRPFSHALFF